jgi:hypothetical protein
MSSLFSSYINKNPKNKSFKTNFNCESESESGNEINITNNIKNSIKSKTFKKNFRLGPPPRKNFFKEKDEKNEIIIKFIVCAAETKDKKGRNESDKRSAKEVNEKNVEMRGGNAEIREIDKEMKNNNETKKKMTKCLMVMEIILMLYYVYTSRTLIEAGINTRRNWANLFKLSHILFFFHILLMAQFYLKNCNN